VRAMTTYRKLNLDEVKDLAPDFGMQTMGQARFAREALGAERIGLAEYRMNPGQRVGFGHRHADSEEVYLVLSGAGRFRVDDDVFEVGSRDVVYCPPQVLREWEAGPEGMALLAFGAHAEGGDAEMAREWWTD
jgi:quercetin dioxygenase-like cupin family protein